MKALHILAIADPNRSSNFAQNFMIFQDTKWRVSNISLSYEAEVMWATFGKITEKQVTFG